MEPELVISPSAVYLYSLPIINTVLQEHEKHRNEAYRAGKKPQQVRAYRVEVGKTPEVVSNSAALRDRKKPLLVVTDPTQKHIYVTV